MTRLEEQTAAHPVATGGKDLDSWEALVAMEAKTVETVAMGGLAAVESPETAGVKEAEEEAAAWRTRTLCSHFQWS